MRSNVPGGHRDGIAMRWKPTFRVPRHRVRARSSEISLTSAATTRVQRRASIRVSTPIEQPGSNARLKRARGKVANVAAYLRCS